MVEVTVYNDQQHDQFTCTSSQFTLYKSSAAPALWRVDEYSENQNQIEAINFCISDEGIVVDGNNTRPLPCILQKGTTWIEISHPTDCQKLVPLRDEGWEETLELSTPSSDHAGPAAATITKWLTQAGQLHRSTASSPEFYADAARFAVETIGLDAALVLKCNQDTNQQEWEIIGSCLKAPQQGIRYQSSALEFLEDQRLAWYQPTPWEIGSKQAVVVAPVVDSEGNLVAALYGMRNTQGKNRRQGILYLHERHS